MSTKPGAIQSSAANDDDAHLEQAIGRFNNLPHTGRSYTGNNRYGYDPNEQLQTVQQSRPAWQATQIEDFKYDKAGNLFDGPKLNGFIKHNRVLVYQDKRYRYDQFGRLSEKRIGSSWVQYFKYDAEHRLVCVDQYRFGERERIEFNYDPLGRRISKEIYSHQEAKPRRRVLFHWHGMRLLQEEQASLLRLYIYTDQISHEPLARFDRYGTQENIEHFHINLAGLPEQLTDQLGNTVWHSDYSGWGNSLNESLTCSSNREQNLRFQGQYLDRETGLHYNTFRYFDTTTGSYTQPDPIGIYGGINTYKYGPNPIAWTDPWGLCRKSGRGWLNWAKRWHDKRVEEIFGKGAGRRFGKFRTYDSYYKGRDIEYKSDNFKNPRSKESIDRMSRQIDRDIQLRDSEYGVRPHWHFENDPRTASDMKAILTKLETANIPWTHGPTVPF